MVRKITALILAFTLLWGNTGFSVNLHYCSSERALYFVLYDSWGTTCETEASSADDSCGMKENSSCCEIMASKLPSPSDGCCSDEEITLKIRDAFSQATRLEAVNAPVVFLVSSFLSFFDNGLLPPGIPIANRVLHALISVFRI
jgi:hypothetical protein